MPMTLEEEERARKSMDKQLRGSRDDEPTLRQRIKAAVDAPDDGGYVLHLTRNDALRLWVMIQR